MNTALISRFTSFGIACVMTLAMLVSVNTLATSEVSPQLVAHVLSTGQS